MKRKIIPSARNRVWEWPAVFNFVLGGAGAGLSLSVFFVGAIQSGTFSAGFPSSIKLLPAGLVLIGFLALIKEAGRPLRGIYLLRNLRSSWMSREILAGFLFVIATMCELLFPTGFFKWLSAIAAFSLLLSHGFIFLRSRAITAWNTPLVVFHYVSSGILLGTGILFVLAPLRIISDTPATVPLFMSLLLIDVLIWLSYLQNPDKSFVESTGKIRRLFSLVQVMGFGRVLPFLILLFLVLLSDTEKTGSLWPTLLSVAGVMIAAGTIRQRTDLILKAFTTREITVGPPEMGRRQSAPQLKGDLLSREGGRMEVLGRR